jgi:hypothetical protein
LFHAHVRNLLIQIPFCLSPQPKSSRPPKSEPPTNILDLPDEVLSFIFSFVEPLEVVRHLPRVCTRFNGIVRHRVPWKHVKLFTGHAYKYTPAVKSIFQAGHFDAECVYVPVLPSNEQTTDLNLQFFLELEWKKLRRVALPVGKGVGNLDTVAPGLAELRLITLKEFEPWMWEEVAALSSHKSLKKVFIAAKDFHWPSWLDYGNLLCPLLAKLESFILVPTVAHCRPDAVLPPPGDRPNLVINLGQELRSLKEVQVTTEMCFSAAHRQPELRNVSTLSYPTVERLSLRAPLYLGNIFAFEASFLLPFTNLTELRFDYMTSLVFRRAEPFFSPRTMDILSHVTKLEITVVYHNNFNMAPLPSMTNLKWLYLNLSYTNSNSVTHELNALEALKSLKTLVNLEGLELKGLPGVRLADKCAKEVFPEWACGNLRWLAFKQVQDRSHQSSTFTEMIDLFPNLEQLSFKVPTFGKISCFFLLVFVFVIHKVLLNPFSYVWILTFMSK